MKSKILILTFLIAIIMTACSPTNPHEEKTDLKTIELSFEPVPIESLEEGVPQENWIKGKSIYFGDLPKQIESTVHLYIEQSTDDIESEWGTVFAFLEHEGYLYELGNVSNYGIGDVEIHLVDRTSDDIKEIEIVGGLGAAYMEMKVIGYDNTKDEWINLLTMGSPHIVDLDGDGQEEILAISVGSLPSFVDLYRWNEDHFERASFSESTGNTYTYVYFDKGKWIIEGGTGVDGKDTEAHYYRYENGKLIEFNKEY